MIPKEYLNKVVPHLLIKFEMNKSKSLNEFMFFI